MPRKQAKSYHSQERPTRFMRHTLVIVDLGWSSDVGLLTVADVASLAAYCQAYGHWRTAEEALARMADRDEHMHGLLIKTVDGNPRRNPLVKVAADAAEDMLRFAGEFGLTPVARTRLAAGGYAQPSPPSKFEGLLR